MPDGIRRAGAAAFRGPLGEIEMKHIIRTVVAAAAFGAAPFATQGADLARVPAAYKVPPPAFWTGCYAGFNLGGGWAPATISDGVTGVNLASITPAGFVGGGQLGCDYQAGLFVFGIQGMASAADIRGSAIQPLTGVTSNFHVPWVETLTARVGFTVQPMTLVYLKGGGAWVRDDITTLVAANPNATGNVTSSGWTVGGGVEFLFFQSWSAFAEYNYHSFSNTSLTLVPPAGAAIAINFNHNVQTLLVGLNYRFNGAFLRPY
jgi:outer membrane immunogenic protein